jgi:phosphoglycolate phosphatase
MQHLVLNRLVDPTSFEAVLFDCDGVLYQSNTVLPGAVEVVNTLLSLKIPVRIITNSSTKTRFDLCKKLHALGFTNIEPQHCYPSGFCAAEYLRTVHPEVKNIYAIGEKGLVEELTMAGFDVFGGPADNAKEMSDSEFIRLGNSSEFSDIHAVVVGYDHSLNYYKLALTSLVFQKNPTCILVGTNPDLHDRIGGKWLVPVNGCALAAVVAAVNNLDNQFKPIDPIITGKPNPLYGNLVLKSSGLGHLDPTKVLMVGDKIETDIRLAKNCGFKSLLVLSGCATDLSRVCETDQPDIVLDGLKDWADMYNRK